MIQDCQRVQTIVLLMTLRILTILPNLKVLPTDVHLILVILGTHFSPKVLRIDNHTTQGNHTIQPGLKTSTTEDHTIQRILSHTIQLFLKDQRTESLMIQESHGTLCFQKALRIVNLSTLDIHTTHLGRRIS